MRLEQMRTSIVMWSVDDDCQTVLTYFLVCPSKLRTYLMAIAQAHYNNLPREELSPSLSGLPLVRSSSTSGLPWTAVTVKLTKHTLVDSSRHSALGTAFPRNHSSLQAVLGRSLVSRTQKDAVTSAAVLAEPSGPHGRT